MYYIYFIIHHAINILWSSSVMSLTPIYIPVSCLADYSLLYLNIIWWQSSRDTWTRDWVQCVLLGNHHSFESRTSSAVDDCYSGFSISQWPSWLTSCFLQKPMQINLRSQNPERKHILCSSHWAYSWPNTKWCWAICMHNDYQDRIHFALRVTTV